MNDSEWITTTPKAIEPISTEEYQIPNSERFNTSGPWEEPRAEQHRLADSTTKCAPLTTSVLFFGGKPLSFGSYH